MAKQISQTDIAYLAGLFDGEGCVTCKQRKTKRPDRGGKVYNQWYIRCEINMTDRAIIKWLHETLGFGSFYKKPPSAKQLGRQMQYRWCCSYRDALKFANLLLPHARVKRKKLQQIIKHYDQLSLRHTDDRHVHIHHVVSRHGDRLLEQEVIEEALWEKLKNWNLGKE